MISISQQIKRAYADLNQESIGDLEPLYDPDIVFIDPVNIIKGRDKILEHFYDTYTNVLSCKFEFHQSNEMLGDEKAYLAWTMRYQHSKLRGGQA